MNYFELRRIFSKKFLGRQSRFKIFSNEKIRSIRSLVKEKGRKSNYRQAYFDFKNPGTVDYQKRERLLNLEEMNSFLEVSLRAQACPMPLNCDVWDGARCPYSCRYCFADYFKASLYSSFFDNVKNMGLRICKPDFFKRELDELMKYRGKGVVGNNEVRNAIGLEIPIRLGIRFEDFAVPEERRGISLELMRYLADQNYPLMINTKSDILGRDEYLRELKRNRGRTAVHMTLISSDRDFLKKMEPGAPSFERRLESARTLVKEGIRVVARLEPYMFLINDSKEMVDDWIEKVYETGIRNITFDTYSYSAYSEGIRRNFYDMGWDFDRMFWFTSESQVLGSVLLEYFMEYFREKGFYCSTFDLGNVPRNDNSVCCEVGDWFEGGFNWGSIVGAILFIKSKGGKPVTWGAFKDWVEEKGGFLSKKLEAEVKRLWRATEIQPYSISWVGGIFPVGEDQDGTVWRWDGKRDWRKELVNEVLKDLREEL